MVRVCIEFEVGLFPHCWVDIVVHRIRVQVAHVDIHINILVVEVAARGHNVRHYCCDCDIMIRKGGGGLCTRCEW
jgi:hypothetical protein